MIRLVEELADTSDLDRRIDGLVARICRGTKSNFAISLRGDAVRAQGYGFNYWIAGTGFSECPVFRDQIWPGFWDPSRQLYNHCTPLMPTRSTREFLERLELPDRGGCEWASRFSFRSMLNLPFAHDGLVFGKLMVFPDRKFTDTREEAARIAPLWRKLTPLWLYRHFLRDLRTFTDGVDRGEAPERAVESLRLARHSFLRADAMFAAGLGARDRRRHALLRPFWGRAETVGELVRIVVVSRDPLLPRGVASFFREAGDPSLLVEIVGIAENFPQALSLSRTSSPAMILVDAPWTADSLSTLTRLRDALSAVPLLVLLDQATSAGVAQLTALGIQGGILRARLEKDFLAAIRRLRAGRTFFGEGVVEHIGIRLDQPVLTETESHVLRLVAQGRTSKEIASLNGITERTVKFHLANLFRKLQVSTRTEAVFVARRNGLLL